MALIDKLTAIGNAIRSKTGTTEMLTLDGMVEAIEGMGSGGDHEKAPRALADSVNFYDYDGTLLYSYSIEEAQALSELPAGPTHDGLIFQAWNWSLEAIKSLTQAATIGAHYITDDGTTRIHISLLQGRTSPMMGLCVNGSVTIDWGDGSEAEVLTGSNATTVVWTARHEYPAPGDYVIRLTIDGSVGLGG